MGQQPISGGAQGIALRGFHKQGRIKRGLETGNAAANRGRIHLEDATCARQAGLARDREKDFHIIPLWVHAGFLLDQTLPIAVIFQRSARD